MPLRARQEDSDRVLQAKDALMREERDSETSEGLAGGRNVPQRLVVGCNHAARVRDAVGFRVDHTSVHRERHTDARRNASGDGSRDQRVDSLCDCRWLRPSDLDRHADEGAERSIGRGLHHDASIN